MIFFRGKPVTNSPLNPRIETKGKDIEVLTKTILTTGGLVQKIILRDQGDHWEVIVGSRRVQALEELRYSEISEKYVKAMKLSDAEACELIAAEALSSIHLSPIEKGKVCKQLLEKYPIRYPVQEVVSGRIGVSQETVSRYIRLYEDYTLAYKEDPTIQDCVNIVEAKRKPNQISVFTFREIAIQFRDQPKIMAEVTKTAARNGLTRSQVRAARDILNMRPNISITEALDEVQKSKAEKKQGIPLRSKSVRTQGGAIGELALCIDLGLSHLQWRITVALGNSQGQIWAKSTENITEKDSEKISEQILRMIRSIQKEGIGTKRIRGVGIGSRGLIDIRKGIVKPPDIGCISLVEPLEDELGLPVHLQGGRVAAVLAEKMFGAGTRTENLVHLNLGAGIGAGVYVNNHLLIGKDGNACEIGHLIIDRDPENSLFCNCGRRGHWEAYSSANAIPNYARSVIKKKKPEELKKSRLMRAIEGKQERISVEDIYSFARHGDMISKEIVESIGVFNAIGCTCLIHAYNPSLITIGGCLALNNTSMVINPIQRHVKKFCVSPLPQIKITPLREDIVLQGTAAMVFYDYLN